MKANHLLYRVTSRRHWPVYFMAGALAMGACSSSPTPVDVDASPEVDASPPPPDAPPRLPVFSHTRGFFDAPFELVITPEFDGTEVRYTLDGRDPAGATAMEYTEPLSIETTTVLRVAFMVDGQLTERTVAHTYLFADDIPNQRAPDEYPTEWWINHKTGPYTADYDMDSQIINDPRSAGQFPGTFLGVPAVSIVMDPDALFGPTGIHENSEEQGTAWERPGSAEIIFPDGQQTPDGKKDLQINCAVSIHGGSSRRPERSAKKSFRLEFKTDYGPAKLETRIYEDSDVDEFDVLVLRGGYNRTWTHYGANQRKRSQYVREKYAAETQRAMGYHSPHTRYSHLFLNGLYWGLIYIQERPNAAWQASYFGGSKSEYDALNIGVPVDGDTVAWDEMMSIVHSGLDTDVKYAQLQQWLDMDAFADYMIMNQYLGNIDWPDRNWYVGRHRSDEGRFRFFNWDAEITLGNENTNVIDLVCIGEGECEDTPGRIWENLRANPEFVVYYGDRIQRHLFNDGQLTPAPARTRWLEISMLAEPNVFAESARWGDHWRDVRSDPEGELYTHADFWLDENDRVFNEVLPGRTDTMIQQFRDAGLFPQFDAPTLSRHGGAVPSGYSLEIFMDGTERQVYYTTDGSDPRLTGGAVSGSALVYATPIVLTSDTPIKARTRLDTGEWSALIDVDFTIE